MEGLRNYLLSENNLSMVETITLNKIHKIHGITLKNDSSFKNSIFMITTAIIREEVNQNSKANNTTVLRINNIIITECVKYISSNLDDSSLEQQELSSKLSEEDSDSFFEELKKDNTEEKIEELKPEFKEEILIFDEYTTRANLKNVISAELVSLNIDFSDYIITENNNCLKIDSKDIVIPIGNYAPKSLIDTINSLTGNVNFNIQEQTDNIIITNSEKETIIDFDVKNSISYILGFSRKAYNLKENLVSENKHRIKHSSFIDVKIQYTEEIQEKHIIYTSVDYNNTIYYTPYFSNKVMLHQQEIEDVKLITQYNTRGRPLMFKIKFVSLVIN